MWAKTPWMIRAYGMALVLIVVVLIVAKVSQALGNSKPPAFPKETILEQQQQIPVREIYGRVDAIIRQALASMQESVNAQ
jgi:Na+-transporting methylmalonyl-CoA/oxaloacetate decarboxylase gamma subunit